MRQMFKLNDKVSVRIHDYINEVDNYYEGIIIDIEECHEYNEESMRRKGIYIKDNPLVKTGRYGIQFINANPTLVAVPYFWEKDLTLL